MPAGRQRGSLANLRHDMRTRSQLQGFDEKKERKKGTSDFKVQPGQQPSVMVTRRGGLKLSDMKTRWCMSGWPSGPSSLTRSSTWRRMASVEQTGADNALSGHFFCSSSVIPCSSPHWYFSPFHLIMRSTSLARSEAVNPGGRSWKKALVETIS